MLMKRNMDWATRLRERRLEHEVAIESALDRLGNPIILVAADLVLGHALQLRGCIAHRHRTANEPHHFDVIFAVPHRHHVLWVYVDGLEEPRDAITLGAAARQHLECPVERLDDACGAKAQCRLEPRSETRELRLGS
eukprot:scaffold6566_cov124-Isochrysis_galbana.AAC.2